MTREEVMKLEGRALDIEIAIRIFGNEIRIEGDSERGFGAFVDMGAGLKVPLPRYSTSMTAAWDVVDRMFRRGYYPEIRYHTNGTGRHDKAKVDVIFHIADHYCGSPCVDNTVTDDPRHVARAICRAALLAVCGEGVGEDAQ